MDDIELKEKLTELIAKSKKNTIEKELECFYNDYNLSQEFLINYIFNDIQDFKTDLFFKYEHYLASYLLSLKVLFEKVFENYDFSKESMMCPVLFNTHHCVELFFKTYKIFYGIVFGSIINPLNGIRPPFIKEIGINNHDVSNLVNDEDSLFAMSIFEMPVDDIANIKKAYEGVVKITGYNKLFENSRYPQELDSCMPIKRNVFNEQSYMELYYCIAIIIDSIYNCLEKRYQKKDFSQSDLKRINNKMNKIKIV